MKNLLYVLIAGVLFISCEKDGLFGHKDKSCPEVSISALPAAVKTAFEKQYPATTASVWFNKDNKAYVAKFSKNGVETLARFSNDGTFENEQMEDQQGDHQDNDEGCECETEDGD